jgi:hypothetical protein
MTTTAFEEILRRAGVEPNGTRQVDVPCPAHEDSTPSLSVGVRNIGDPGAVVSCQADCPASAVMAAFDLPMAALFDSWWNRRNGNGGGPQVIYTYTDEDGEPLFEVGRFAGKKFLQRRPGRTDWKGGVKGVRRVLYRLPEVIAAAQAGRVVYVVEGEKDVEALALAGEVATTSPAGAGKWRPEYAESLRGARVVVVADKDAAGRKHAQEVAASLHGIAATVSVVEALEGKDAFDHLLAGHDIGKFVKVESDAAAVSTPKVEAPPTDALLAAIWQFVARFVILPGPAEYRAIALFVAHTWAFEAAHATPYIVVESPEKQSGKTRLLEVLELVCRGATKVASISAAGLFQTIGDGHPTLLIDEADAIFAGNTDRNEDLRGVLNAGNAPGSKVIRGGKDGKPISYEVYCPKVIAGIATGRLPDTIRDRAIVVPIDRKLRSEPVERLRRRLLQAELDTLRGQLAAWAGLHHDRLYGYELRSPLEKISDRLEEAWEPLLAIAELAGGEWPEAAIGAAEKLAGEGDEDATASHALLIALRDVFGEREALSTREILTALNADDELPFGSWNDGKGITARELGRLLKRYRVKPRSVRQADGSVLRGYRREQFESVWDRYGGSSSATSATSTAQSQNPGVRYPLQTPPVADSGQAANPHGIRDVADVADKTRPTRSDSICGTCGGLLADVNGEPVCFGCGGAD